MTRVALPGDYELDDDRARIDVAAVARFLHEDSYWAAGRPVPVIAELIDTAQRTVGLYAPGGALSGFSRTLTDGHVVAYLADVFVLPEHRGDGRGTALVRETVEDGPYARLRWLLHTADAHGLYERFGFERRGERLMERLPRR